MYVAMGGLHLPLGVVRIFRLDGLHLPLQVVCIFRFKWFASSAWVVCLFRLGNPRMAIAPWEAITPEHFVERHNTIHQYLYVTKTLAHKLTSGALWDKLFETQCREIPLFIRLHTIKDEHPKCWEVLVTKLSIVRNHFVV